MLQSLYSAYSSTWWLMKVSALKTISMNKEDKEKCPHYSLNVWKVISLLWTLYVLSPFDLAYLSYIFCKTARPWNYLFIPPPWPMPVLSRQEAQMRQVHWPGKGSNLASENLYSILEFDWNWKRVVKEIGPNNRVRVFVPMVRYLSIRK